MEQTIEKKKENRENIKKAKCANEIHEKLKKNTLILVTFVDFEKITKK